MTFLFFLAASFVPPNTTRSLTYPRHTHFSSHVEAACKTQANKS